MRFRLSEVAAATGGAVAGGDATVDGATIDSRELRPGQLFVPVVSARDGHDFVAAALAAGAGGYLTAREPVDGHAVVVDDTAAALLALGGAARGRLPDRVVGITGSVGKTTVKDLLASILRRRFRTAASVRSFNNELGVPLTLLEAADDTEAAVVEMGARGIGHIALLCSVARPTVGVVTAVAMAHTEFFGSVEEVARGKGELIESLPAEGTAVLNARYDLVAAMAGRTDAHVVTYGTERADVRAVGIELDEALRPRFRLESPWGSASVEVALAGEHQADNALAAAAAALAAGATLDDVVEGLASAEASPWRMDVRRAPSGAVIINDSYNANPTSTAAALRALARVPARRRIAVLGTMAELGDDSDVEHARIAAVASDLGIRVIAVDEPAYGVEEIVPDADAAGEAVGPVGEGDAVLVKGSRVAGLEKLAETLLS